MFLFLSLFFRYTAFFSEKQIAYDKKRYALLPLLLNFALE
jgi:hypothetical protein